MITQAMLLSQRLQPRVFLDNSRSIPAGLPHKNFAVRMPDKTEVVRRQLVEEGHITFQWLAGHCGIMLNEQADEAARRAHENAVQEPIPLSKPMQRQSFVYSRVMPLDPCGTRQVSGILDCTAWTHPSDYIIHLEFPESIQLLYADGGLEYLLRML